MSNRFTSSLQDCVKENIKMSMSDVYYRLFQNTVGSHVCVYGSAGFGNMHQQTLEEWFAPIRGQVPLRSNHRPQD